MGTCPCETCPFCPSFLNLRCWCAYWQQVLTAVWHAQGFGYALSLLGFFWYNYIKMQPTPAPAYAAVPVRDTDGATKP